MDCPRAAEAEEPRDERFSLRRKKRVREESSNETVVPAPLNAFRLCICYDVIDD